MGLRIVVTGATGNVGTSLLDALGRDDSVESVVGIARRLPRARYDKVEWVAADVARDDLVPHFRGADAVVHLAWLIQPSRDLDLLRRVNVEGSRRVLRAVGEADVPAVIAASSVGAYSPGPKDRTVDESWPTGGIPTSFYSRHKAELERLLDAFASEHAARRVVRLRPALIFKRESAQEQRRLFAGPFLPSRLAQPKFVPIVPDVPRLRFQAVHSYDVGEAYRLAAVGDARGAYNIAADPILDPERLGRLLHARPVRMSARLLRALVHVTWKLRLQPTPPGWLDLALQTPLLDPARARTELGWEPTFTSLDALRDLLDGMASRSGAPTPPLDPDLRWLKELAGRVGGSP
jgi:nucleoside-diphosphate-sugar epimerase